jgi:glyoxylase-like metal-dependent hydrolase (beta-lactamase superfamily II)
LPGRGVAIVAIVALVSRPDIQHFYHPPTGTLSYVVSDPQTGRAAVIDSLLGFDAVSGRTHREPPQAIVDFIRERSLQIDWILETHAHADHLSAAQFIQHAVGGSIAIGDGIRSVQAHFAPLFNLHPRAAADGHPFDHLFRDGDAFGIGELECRVMATPGHTNDSITYRIGDAAFVGDSLFMPDVGTARCDFPGGDAGLLYDSIQAILALPGEIRLLMCHDYPPEGRTLRFETSIAKQKKSNIHVRDGVTREAFIALRQKRDATLSLPALLLPAIRVNICAGKLPQCEDNGIAYIKIPLDTL